MLIDEKYIRRRIAGYKDGNGDMEYTPQYKIKWWHWWINYTMSDGWGGQTRAKFPTIEEAQSWVLKKIEHDDWIEKRNHRELYCTYEIHVTVNDQ
jgi:hypothetical protein